jgi:hypothetical protein
MSEHRGAPELRRLHVAVDTLAATLFDVHRARMSCRRGCASCCIDDITVWEVEADRIREECGDVLRGTPGPAGGCAMLDGDGGCRIYAARPYVCRTQGLPLRWLDGRGRERRDICELNARGEPSIEDLPAQQCWTLGAVEERLRALNGGPGRVALRSLFVTA